MFAYMLWGEVMTAQDGPLNVKFATASGDSNPWTPVVTLTSQHLCEAIGGSKNPCVMNS